LIIPLGLTSIHNYLAGKDPAPLTTHGGINFYIGNHQGASGAWEAPEGIEASVSAINLEESKRFAEQSLGKELTTSQVSRFWYGRAVRFIVRHPVEWLLLMVKKTLLFWSSFETPLNFNYYFHQHYSWLLSVPLFNLVVVMPMALWGLLYNLPQWRQKWLLYALIGTICLSVILFFVSGRYRLPILPFLLIFAAAGLAGLWQMIRVPGPRRWIWSIVLLVLFTSQILYSHSRVKHSNFANDYYNLSLAHIMDENFEEAIRFAELAVEADSSYVDAYYNLGIAYMRLREYDKSFDAFSHVVSLDPGEIGGHRNLGALLLLRGEYDQALHHLQIAVEGEPANVNSLMNLGLAYFYLQRYGEAIGAWERLLEVDPRNDQARNNIRAARAAMVIK
jgi:Tfp pilus assembly protein PilF